MELVFDDDYIEKTEEYYNDLYNKYEKNLNKYYNFNKYINDIDTESIILNKFIHSGNKKTVNLVEFSNGNKYAVTVYSTDDNDIEIHLDIIDKYYLTGGYERYKFKIPLIYRINNLLGNNVSYVMELVEFDFETEKYFAKNFRLEEKDCTIFGNFFKFIVDECGYDIKDVESYYDKNNILYFLDFGEFIKLDDTQRIIYKKEFIDRLENTYCQGDMILLKEIHSTTYKKLDMSDEKCIKGVKCILNTIK
jgi:hypothetical protein